MTDCIFCKIAHKEIPSDFLYEDDQVVVFRDLNPVAPVHVLIVPKKHYQDLNDLDKSGEAGLVFQSVARAARQVADQLGVLDSGYRLINNCGKDAGQTVLHLHFHLIGGVAMGDKLL